MSQSKMPWEEENVPWKTESAYFSWLRGQIRRAWMRYPVSNNFKRAKAQPPSTVYKMTGGKGKRTGICEICGVEEAISKLQVDHIVPAGSLRGYEDLPAFCARLFCSADNLRLLCKKCHEVVTYSQKTGLSFEDCIKEKKVVEFKKLKAEKQVAALTKLGAKPAATKAGREAQYRSLTAN